MKIAKKIASNKKKTMLAKKKVCCKIKRKKIDVIEQ